MLSFLAFAISAQIQKSKLADGVGDVLDGDPFLLAGPQTILVLGTDVRSGAFAGPDEAETEKCIEAVTSGRPTDNNCKHGPYRSDTIMLIRAGAGTFRKLSIPRDTLADDPRPGPAEDQLRLRDRRREARGADGRGPARDRHRPGRDHRLRRLSQVHRRDRRDHGRPADRRSARSVSGGAFKLDLEEGENDLDGFQAITLARTRENTCGAGAFAGTDVERAQFQQLILDGIKGKLTSITSLPLNFIKGPLIGWNAPKAMVSSMGMLTMPQLAISAATGGGGGTDVLKPSGTTAAGNLVISPEECERAAEALLGGKPPRKPNCPQS